MMASTRNQFHYAVRVVKRQGKLIQAKKLFEASLTSEVDLLKEMKAVKRGGKAPEDLPEHVSGADGEAELLRNSERFMKHCIILLAQLKK